MMEWEGVSFEDLSMGELQPAIQALMKHLGLKMERKRYYDGGTEFRFVSEPKEP